MTSTICTFACCAVLFIQIVFMFEQNQYSLKYERGELAWFNRSYGNTAKVTTFKYNRTQAFTNLTFNLNKAMGRKMIIRVQAYKFSSNEYRLFPMRFQFNYCDFAEKNEFGLHRTMECGNFSCPVKTGWYHICNFALDAKRCPPLIPAGQWKLEVAYLDKVAEMLIINFYVTISYPIAYSV